MARWRSDPHCRTSPQLQMDAVRACAVPVILGLTPWALVKSIRGIAEQFLDQGHGKFEQNNQAKGVQYKITVSPSRTTYIPLLICSFRPA